MHLVRGLHTLAPMMDGCALTIGNFDGLHRGHQAVIAQLNTRAAELGVPSAMMTFEPMPSEFFCPADAPARLSSLREKIEDARAFGVDVFVRVAFDRAFASMSADAFLQTLLADKLRVRHVLVGEDFRFARAREGDVAQLRAFARAQGFEVAPMPTVEVDGQRVSSTRVRAALAAGDVDTARVLLGRAYRISGRVAGGERLGRTLGFPTANIRMMRRPAPCYGVYAVRVTLPDGRVCRGAASLGVRPTVDGRDCLLEVYLLDFDGDLYGQRIDVCFEAFIRPETRFDSLGAMTRQIQADVADVRSLLA